MRHRCGALGTPPSLGWAPRPTDFELLQPAGGCREHRRSEVSGRPRALCEFNLPAINSHSAVPPVSNGMDAPTRNRHRSAKVEVCATT